MMRTCQRALAAFFWATLAIPGWAQDVLSQASSKQGAVYEYEKADLMKGGAVLQTWEHTVMDVEGQQARFQIRVNDAPRPDGVFDLAKHAFPVSRASGMREYVGFPGKVGQEWDWKMSYPWAPNPSITLYHEVEAKFVGWEEVTVPAGKFRAAKVEHRGWWRTSTGSNGRVEIDV
jgi:hypothetical protein